MGLTPRTKYISFGTFRNDGSLAATPVWVVPYREGYAFTTEATSFKVKRLGHSPRVSVATCDIRGRVSDGEQRMSGTARLLDGHETAAVTRLIRRKYWLGWYLLIVPSQLIKKLRRKAAPADIGIAFSLDTDR